MAGKSFTLAVVLLCLLGAHASFAQATFPNDPKSLISLDEQNRSYFTDLEVITHEGDKARFYSDILKDKLVLINFFYTNCPTAPPGLARFFKIQQGLGDALGESILLLSISVDPERDNPEAVREYARKFSPKKGWLFVTGPKQNMDIINRRLGNTLNLPEGHLQIFLLGNLKSGHWMKMQPTAPPNSIIEGLKSLDSR